MSILGMTLGITFGDGDDANFSIMYLSTKKILQNTRETLLGHFGRRENSRTRSSSGKQ